MPCQLRPLRLSPAPGRLSSVKSFGMCDVVPALSRSSPQDAGVNLKDPTAPLWRKAGLSNLLKRVPSAVRFALRHG
jgi:hypothetical protein